MKTLSLMPILAGSLLLAACGGQDAASGSHPQGRAPTQTVRTATVSPGEETIHRILSGTVVPRERAELTARVSGQVRLADFEVGDWVSAGSVLVVLDAPELDARVEAAAAALAQIERDLERETGLLEQNATTQEQVRSLQDARRQAAARLAEAEAIRGYTQIAAPFEGQVTAKRVETGDVVQPGSPLFFLETLSALQVEVAVPAGLPRLGLDAAVAVEDHGRIVTATVAAISRSLEPSTRSYPALLNLPEGPPFVSNQFVRVRWPERVVDMITVQQGAVRRRGSLEQVFVVEEGIARMRLIRTGIEVGDRVQVQSGLRPGDRVVLEPSSSLIDGAGVEVE